MFRFFLRESSLTITNADAAEVLQNLPDDLSPERRAVVQNALTLYGKVSYFWGGKSLVLGWDSRRGQLRQVTAAGSSTTGAYRPYGLDCSGFLCRLKIHLISEPGVWHCFL